MKTDGNIIKSVGIFLTFLIFIVISFLYRPALLDSKPGKIDLDRTLRMGGILKKETGFSPFYLIDSDNFVPKTFLFSALVEINQEGEVTGDIADDWYFNEEGKTVTFFLRKNVLFHNGKVLSAEDVAWTYRQLMSNEGIFYRQQYGFIDSVNVIDEYTIQFKLKRIPDMFFFMFTFNIVSSDSGAEDRDHAFKFAPVGSGPFFFKELQGDGSVLLERFESYYKEKPHFQYFQFKSYHSRNACWAAFLRNDVDMFINLGADNLAMIKNADWCQIKEYPGSRYFVLFLNVEHDLLQDIRLRQAIEMSIDRNHMIQTEYQGLASPIFSPLPENSVLFNPSVKHDYHPEEAMQLIRQAGFQQRPEDFMFSKEQSVFELKLLVNPSSSRDLNIAKCIKLQLFKVGIRVLIIKNTKIDPESESLFTDSSIALYLGQKALHFNGLAFSYWDQTFGICNLKFNDQVQREAYSRVLAQITDKDMDIDAQKQCFYSLQEMIDRQKNSIFLLYPIEVSAFQKRVDMHGTHFASPFVRTRGLKNIQLKKGEIT